MNNVVFGIFTLGICSVGYFYAWKFFCKEKFIATLFLICLCGLVLRFFFISDFYLHDWDERFHALVAKNLIKHPFLPTLYDNAVLPYDYKNWSANHIWLHKPPLTLWFMAGSMWLFGENELALRLPSILLTTIGIYLTFSIGSFLSDKKVGLLAAFFYSINGLILDLGAGRAATDHVDIFFLFFIELAILFSILFARKHKTVYTILAGASIGLAILSKSLPALIVFPIWLLIVLISKKFRFKEILLNFSILAATCLLVVLPWNLYIYYTFPLEANWEAILRIKHFTESIEGQGEPFYYYLNRIRIDYGEVIYLPIIWFAWTLSKDIKNFSKWVLMIWFSVPILVFSMSVTKMGAYILFAAPAIFIVTAEFFFFILEYKKGKKQKWIYNMVLFLLIALPIRYTIERMKPLQFKSRSPEWVSELKELNGRNIENGVLFNYSKPIEAMFYTNLTVYPYLPSKEIILDIYHKGYKVIVNDDNNLPQEVLSMQEVEFVRMRNL